MTITLQKGRYEALEPLGSGATSRVEKARDNVIGRIVALKTFVNGFGEGQKQQFLREAQIIGQLSNASIVQLYDVGIDEQGTPFLVMEYIAGQTLEHHLDPTTLTVQRACAWAADLAGALAAAHRAEIIHGDVKPGNVLVTPENKVKLGDFGIARFASQVSGSGRLMGTPAYLAPEQIQGEPHDARSDQFALGIVLYQMLTGMRPFNGASVGAVCAQILNAEPPPPSQFNPSVPQGLDRVLVRCLAKNPRDRFDSCNDLASALYPFARARQPEARKLKKRSWWSKPLRARDVWISALACLLLAAILPAARSVRGWYATPVAPARLRFSPTVPADAYSYTSQSTIAALESNVIDAVTPATQQKRPAKRGQTRIGKHAGKLAATVGGQTRDSEHSLSQKTPAAARPLPLPNEAAKQTAQTPSLQIEITSAAKEGTVAVFADQELLVTINLPTERPGEPVRFERALSAGAHRFRVALYKSDESLQSEKEGLAEIGSKGPNTLTVHVNRHTKLLVRHALALEVVWPGASGRPAEHASTKMKTAAFMK